MAAEASTLRAGKRVGGGGILPIMRAAERADARKIDAGGLAALFHLMQHAIGDIDSGCDGMADGDAFHRDRAL